MFFKVANLAVRSANKYLEANRIFGYDVLRRWFGKQFASFALHVAGFGDLTPGQRLFLFLSEVADS